MQALILAASLLLAANYGGSSQRISGTVSTSSNPNAAYNALNANSVTTTTVTYQTGNGNTLNANSVTTQALTYVTGNGNALNANTVTTKTVSATGNANFSLPILIGTPGGVSATYGPHGNGVATQVNTGSWYFADEFAAAYGYPAGGTVGGSESAPAAPALAGGNAFGVRFVETTSTTAGGTSIGSLNFALIKSASVTYQWRVRFYTPAAASTSTNRYTIFIGGFYATGGATNAFAPTTGPYLKYSDNVGSPAGNWVLGSAVNNTQNPTPTNTSVAPTFAAWHNLTITLVNGTYTFVLDGTTLGTLADSNIPTTGTNTSVASYWGQAIVPDGANFTSSQVLVTDRADIYITGIPR